MYSSLTLLKKYVQYLIQSENGNGHGVHSPFVFTFIKEVLNKKEITPLATKIELRRKALKDNTQKIEVWDRGAGSRQTDHTERSIQQIAKAALKPKKYSQLLHKIVAYYQPAQILEMGTSFKNARGKDLYAFWGDLVTNSLKSILEKQKNPLLLNLASEEYFKVIKAKELNCTLITPIFQDAKDGKYKIISFYAKRARGLMARYVVENRITNVDDLKDFNLDGYQFIASESKPEKPVFRRAEKK